MTAPSAAPVTAIETDAVIVGAGPVGLFQVFELGLLEIRAHVIDSLPFVGGQCIELYADKPIYDIPATQVCTGRELISRLQQQIAPFSASFHLGQQVDSIRKLDDGRFEVDTSAGVRLHAKAVVIAGGVGSFQPRRLKVEGITAFEGKQLFYSGAETADVSSKNIVIIGDGDAALELALRATEPGPQQAASVTLMHRRDDFKAAEETIAAVQEQRNQGCIAFVAAQAVGIEQNDGRLGALQVLTSEGATRALPLDALFVLTGLSPKLGPIAEWGVALERKQVKVNTETFETSTPGIFAVGDVNTYPGKKKLILSGFHEAALAAFGAAPYVFPGKAIHLEYTTTSPRLHRVLGVARPPEQ
jgi:thioredoxin reductase (NADPH)